MRALSSPSAPSVRKAADELVDLLEQHAALQHAGGLFVVEKVGADDVADRMLSDVRRGLVDDPQLRAQHAGLARLVDARSASSQNRRRVGSSG